MVYDDEKLSPESFEQMAKEYAKNRKKSIDNLLPIFETIICLKNNLKKFKLNKVYSKKLDKISENTNILNNYIQENNYNIKERNFNTNYCALLVMLISSCIDARSILDKSDKLNYEIKDALDNITRTSATMFGVCKYRILE